MKASVCPLCPLLYSILDNFPSSRGRWWIYSLLTLPLPPPPPCFLLTDASYPELVPVAWPWTASGLTLPPTARRDWPSLRSSGVSPWSSVGTLSGPLLWPLDSPPQCPPAASPESSPLLLINYLSSPKLPPFLASPSSYTLASASASDLCVCTPYVAVAMPLIPVLDVIVIFRPPCNHCHRPNPFSLLLKGSVTWVHFIPEAT